MSNDTTFFKKYQSQIALIGILALAFGLRVWGLDFGLPNLSRPDEQNISNPFILAIFPSFVVGHPNLNPHFFNYPSLFLYLSSLCFGLYYGIGKMLGIFPTPESFISLYLNDWSSFLLIERWLSALFGTVGVWAIIRLGTALARSKFFGLCCGLLLAVTFLHVRDSHFGVTDITATTLATLCLWQSVSAIRKHDSSALLRAAVLAGLAASTKYPLGIVAVAPFSAFYILAKAQGARAGDFIQKTPLVAQELKLLGCLVGAFLIASPYILFDFSGFQHDFLWQSNSFNHLFDNENIAVGWIRHLSFSLRYGLGPLYVIAGLAGMGLAIRSRQAFHWPLLIFAALFYAVIGANKTVFVRYSIPLIPIFCIYAVWVLAWISQMLRKRLSNAQSMCLVGLLGVLVAWSSVTHSIRFDWLSARTDTRSSARTWLIAHMMPGDSVGIGKMLSHIDLPVDYKKYFLKPMEDVRISPHSSGHFTLPSPAKFDRQSRTERNEYAISTYSDADTLRRLNIQYVAVARSPLKIFGTPDIEIEALLQNPELELAQVFLNTPSGKTSPPESAYDWEDAFYLPYSQFGSLTNPGPDVLIFRVRPPVGHPNQKSR